MVGKLAFALFLFGAAFVMGKPSKKNEELCHIKRINRVDCGWIGIDKATCEKKSCCWNDTARDSPYCYRSKLGRVPSCFVKPGSKIDCGWLGIDKETCLKRGCCWDDTNPNEYYCYVKEHSNLRYGLCPVAPSERQECGYFGITKEECLKKTCCWDPTVPNTKWCFKQPVFQPDFCYIWRIPGKCQYVCPPDQPERAYGECSEGRACCYKGFYPGGK